MATRARIGVLRPDGRVESIYNHYDGYIEGGLGDALKTFTNPQDIDELIKLGNRRGLYKEIHGTPYDWRDKKDLYNEPSSFYNNEQEFFDDDNEYLDYKYLYKNGSWQVYGPDESAWGSSLRPLVKPTKIYKEKAATAPNLRRRFKSPLDQANALMEDK